MTRILAIILTDFKLIFRDPSLRIFLVMPGLILLIILVLLPYLIHKNPLIEPYVPLIIMGAMMQSSVMFGFIYSMVLIHEKELSVAKIYGVLPISKPKLILSRLIIPFLIASTVTFLLFVLQPFFTSYYSWYLLLAILCGLMAPFLALLIATLSKNKMEGMTWFKLVNLLIVVPLAAFFIPGSDHWFGFIPTHWAYQMLDCLIKDHSVLLVFAIGFLYSVIAILIVTKKFVASHFR